MRNGSAEEIQFERFRDRLPEEKIRALVVELDEALRDTGFTRGGVWLLRDAPGWADRWESIATWERFTEEAATRMTFNGISLYANGFVSASVHGESHASFRFEAAQDMRVAAETVAAYVRSTDRLFGVALMP